LSIADRGKSSVRIFFKNYSMVLNMSLDREKLNFKEKDSKYLRYLFILFVCLLACGSYYFFLVANARVVVDIEVTEPSTFQIYWAAPGENYSEARMSLVPVTTKKKIYSFHLTDIGKVERLRIDTQQYAGDATIHTLSITQEGYLPLHFDGRAGFDLLTPLNQVETFSIDENGLRVRSEGKDPHFELKLNPEQSGLDYGWLLARFIGLAGAVLLLLHGVRPLLEDLKIVPVFLAGTLMLICTMSATTAYNAHPDEYVHLAATSYYADHWLPPEVNDPGIVDSYSVYGGSRLNNGEIYYLFSGKVYQLLKVFEVPDLLAKRMFNVLLFGGIFFYCVRNVYARLVAIPLLVSPQLWYLFGYCDSDAFAVFITFVAASQLLDPGSLLHRYLKGEGGRAIITGIMVLPFFLGILFLLKKNYYPFIALFYLGLSLKLLFSEQYYWERKDAIKRIVVITLLGAMICGLRIGVDYAVNGVDRAEKIEGIKEQLALHEYKPSTPLEEKNPLLLYRDRGHTLPDLVNKFHWDKQSFESAFGVFGYFTIWSPQQYYELVKWTGLALLIFIFGSVLFRGGIAGNVMSFSTLGLSAALIGASLYQSWIYDFQAQGRYLLPILMMLSIVYGWNYRVVNRKVLVLFTGCLYALATYCFIFQALLRLPKIIS
jgi:hypothetical protein